MKAFSKTLGLKPVRIILTVASILLLFPMQEMGLLFVPFIIYGIWRRA